jgi:hypothetical protein
VSHPHKVFALLLLMRVEKFLAWVTQTFQNLYDSLAAPILFVIRLHLFDFQNYKVPHNKPDKLHHHDNHSDLSSDFCASATNSLTIPLLPKQGHYRKAASISVS